MASLLIITVLCLATAYGSPVGTDPPISGPYIELYSGEGHTGASITITEYAHDLSVLGWDNLAKSFCAEGVWVLYDNANYNMHHDPFSSWSEVIINSARGCHDIPVTHHGKLSSLRFAGSGDLHDETATMYHGYFYMGGEDLIIRDMDELGDFEREASSMIVTGETPWTVYSEEYYEGVSICLEPWNVGNSVYVGAFEVYTIGMPNNVISSIRKGCFAKDVIKYQPKLQ
ncbi:unnamed protein product [Meganyctiphanes norvegica]|uniref:Uncharacterized protein n=1 Tax=Meganyctiphanes norvegica TaxID=48144 RepID=A0AAV2S8L2_MEGNR